VEALEETLLEVPASTVSFLGGITNEPTGWVDRGEATISVVVDPNPATTQRVVITPSTSAGFRVYVGGVLTTFKAPVEVEIAPVEGWHYVWWDGESWHESGDFPSATFTQVGLTCFVHFDAGNRVFDRVNDERHGITMDGATHRHLHFTLGTRYLSGFGATATADATTAAPASDDQSRIALAGGMFADEDIVASVVHALAPAAPFQQNLGTGLGEGTAAILPIFYLDGTGLLRRYNPANPGRFAFKPGAVYPQYNKPGAAWSLAEPGSDERVIYWVCATNSLESPVFLMMGQATYPSLTAAQGATPGGIAWGSAPFAEIIVLYRIVFRCRVNYANATYKAKIEALDATPAGGTVAVPAIQSHSSLAGLAFSQSGHTGFQRAAYLAAGIPTKDADGVDTGGIGRTFAPGDTWVDTVGGSTYRCISNGTGAAVWDGHCHGAMRLNAPATLLLDVGGVAEKVVGFAGAPSLSGFTFASNELTHTFFDGVYHFTGSCDLAVDKACTVTLELYVDGAPTGLATPHTFTAASKTETVSITELVDLDRGEVVSVTARSSEGNTTLTLSTLSVVFARC
jgi:hypothetical protein